MFTTQHYEIIADTIRDRRNATLERGGLCMDSTLAEYRRLVYDLCETFKADNPRFKEEIFKRRVNMTD